MSTHSRNTKPLPLETQIELASKIDVAETLTGRISYVHKSDYGGFSCRVSGIIHNFAPGLMSRLFRKFLEKGTIANITAINYKNDYKWHIVSFEIPKLAIIYVDEQLASVLYQYEVIQEQIAAEKARKEQLRLQNEGKRKSHRDLLHNYISEGYRPMMLLETINNQNTLKAIYWISRSVKFIDAALSIYKQYGIDATKQRNGIHAHDWLSGGGFYHLTDTNYTLYCCQPTNKKKACMCGKDTHEEGDYNHSLMDGVEHASYYCEYCFFERNEIVVEDSFITNPNHHILNYTDEALEAIERKRAEKWAQLEAALYGAQNV